jgi:hypothetical protein
VSEDHRSKESEAMSIVRKTSQLSYKLTPHQLLQLIAADMQVAPEAIDVVFHTGVTGGDMFDREQCVTFTGCTVVVKP